MNNKLLYSIELVFTITLGAISFGIASSKGAATLTLHALANYPIPGLAQPTPPTRNSSDSIPIRYQEQDSDGSSRGRPSDREGTGSRGDCPPVDVQLTALVPSSNLGFSVEAHPTLWFYVPYKSSEVASAEFSLQDEQNNDVYRTNFTLPESPGIVGLNLAQVPPLEINKKYQWYVKIYCSRQKISAPVFIRSWVEQIPLKTELERQLQTATTPRQRLAIYAQNGIWYSALTELAKLRLLSPQKANFSEDWANLLRDVNLENLTQKPLSGVVNIEQK